MFTWDREKLHSGIKLFVRQTCINIGLLHFYRWILNKKISFLCTFSLGTYFKGKQAELFVYSQSFYENER